MKALIFGAGGAGDVISAILASEYYKKLGYETLIGSILWERYVIDPVPGPINFEDLRNAEKINDCIFLLRKDSYAIREGNLVIPTIVRVLKVLNLEQGYAMNNRLGPKHLAKCIKEIVNKENIDLIVAVDAGGDMIARGDEESIMSPLVDVISLATLIILEKEGYKTLLGVIGCGSDGEVEHDYFLKLISEIAKNKGLIDIKGYDLETAKLVEKVLENTESEASKIPVDAFFGFHGELKIRKGTRKVFVTPASAVMFFLDPLKITTNKLVGKIINANSLEDANSILNSMGIYTEYDFERDIFKLYGLEAKNIDAEDMIKIRKEGKKRL